MNKKFGEKAILGYLLIDIGINRIRDTTNHTDVEGKRILNSLRKQECILNLCADLFWQIYMSMKLGGKYKLVDD